LIAAAFAAADIFDATFALFMPPPTPVFDASMIFRYFLILFRHFMLFLFLFSPLSSSPPMPLICHMFSVAYD